MATYAPHPAAPDPTGEAAPSSTHDRPNLEYAPAPMPHRRRARRAILTLMLIATMGCAWRWRQPLIAHARLIYFQRACENYRSAPDTVVATVDSIGAQQASFVPPCWAPYEAATLVVKQPRPSAKFSQARMGIAFLHGRRSPGGHERIVAVRCYAGYLASASVAQAFQPVVVEPAPLWPLSSAAVLREGRFAGGYPMNFKVQVFSGQPDEADPAHFTIAYTVNGRPGTIDGTLNDDDTVKLRVRPGSTDVMEMRKAAQPDAPKPTE